MENNDYDRVEMYPMTIIYDRYGGTYSGGEWLAFPLEFHEVPDEVCGCDGECMWFWDYYKGFVGKGRCPEEARDNLIALFYKDFYKE